MIIILFLFATLAVVKAGGIQGGIYEDATCTTFKQFPPGPPPNPYKYAFNDCVAPLGDKGNPMGFEALSCGGGFANLNIYQQGCGTSAQNTKLPTNKCTGANGFYTMWTCYS